MKGALAAVILAIALVWVLRGLRVRLRALRNARAVMQDYRDGTDAKRSDRTPSRGQTRAAEAHADGPRE